MNIPVDDNGMVHFKPCLFGMCREALGIYMKDGKCETHESADSTTVEVEVRNDWAF
jgi:hypothetical protein